MRLHATKQTLRGQRGLSSLVLGDLVLSVLIALLAIGVLSLGDVNLNGVRKRVTMGGSSTQFV